MIPSDEDYIKQARAILLKLNNRIEKLMRERERLSSTLKTYIGGYKSLIKICPFCGQSINPFKDKIPNSIRTFSCSKCKRTFSITLKREG